MRQPFPSSVPPVHEFVGCCKRLPGVHLCCIPHHTKTKWNGNYRVFLADRTWEFLCSSPYSKQVNSYYSCIFCSYRERTQQTYNRREQLRGGMADVPTQNCGFTEEALGIGVCTLTIACSSASFSDVRNHHDHAATCSLRSTCGANAAPCSAMGHARLEGITVAAHSSLLRAVIIMPSSLQCVANERPHHRSFKVSIPTVQTVSASRLFKLMKHIV